MLIAGLSSITLTPVKTHWVLQSMVQWGLQNCKLLLGQMELSLLKSAIAGGMQTLADEWLAFRYEGLYVSVTEKVLWLSCFALTFAIKYMAW